MKISVNDTELFTLTETQKLVIKNTVMASLFEDDMKRRLEWILMHLYDECFKTLKAEWDPKLAAAGVEMIPTNKDAYAQLVFAQPTYLDREGRENENIG